MNKRFAEGLSFLVSYTISKNITDADSSGPGVQGFTGANAWIGQNSYNRRAEKAVSELDTPQRLVTSFFYELPVGRGKRLLNSGGWSNGIVGGWSVSGILSYQSGLPTAVYSSCSGTAGDVLFAGCHFTGSARVNIVPGVKQSNGRDLNPFTTPFFNANAFSAPAPLTFGNEPRTLASARAPGGRNEDITIGKKPGSQSEGSSTSGLHFSTSSIATFCSNPVVPEGLPLSWVRRLCPPGVAIANRRLPAALARSPVPAGRGLSSLGSRLNIDVDALLGNYFLSRA